jgi:hypothetical protein
MWHMEAFRSSLASGVTDVFQQVSYIQAGAVLAPAGTNSMQVSAFLPFVHSLFGVGAHLENIQPQASSFLPLPNPVFAANNIGTAAESPPRFWDLSRFPKALRPTETFSIFASQTSGGAENEAVFVNFSDNTMKPAPQIASGPAINGNGQMTTVHGTATTTLTANGWTQVFPLIDSPGLPAGLYALVGARVMSAGALAFRLKPVVEPLWRPGGVAVQTADQLDAPNQRYFNPTTGRISKWGVWITFYQNTPPFVDIWSTSADTKEDFFFDLIKISDVTTSGAL